MDIKDCKENMWITVLDRPNPEKEDILPGTYQIDYIPKHIDSPPCGYLFLKKCTSQRDGYCTTMVWESEILHSRPATRKEILAAKIGQ